MSTVGERASIFRHLLCFVSIFSKSVCNHYKSGVWKMTSFVRIKFAKETELNSLMQTFLCHSLLK
jgi:hypothetical protein